MEENILKIENTDRLNKLYKFLNYEISSSILFLVSWIVPLFIPLIFFAAIAFTPYLLYVLFKEGKNLWILFFVIFVIFPALITIMFFPLLTMIVLVPFYLFCFLLRIEVKDWLHELRAKNELAIQKIKKMKQSNEFEDIFDVRN